MPKRAKLVGVLATGAALLAGGSVGLAPMGATASSHREAPLISSQPEYDNTDVYAFVSPDKPDTTTLVANFWPLEEPAGGPNFYKFAKDGLYEINVDNDGDSLPEYTYRWDFKDSYRNRNTFLYNTGPVTSLDDPDLNFRQTYDLTLISRKAGAVTGVRTLASNVPVAPSFVGNASMPNYGALRQQATKTLPSGAKVYAGQADDAFFLDLRVFNLLYGGNLKEVGNDTLRGFNVQTLAIQVPTKALIKPGQPIIGVYSATKRSNAAGSAGQVSRLGNALVNEVVIPLKDKDKFNASVPWGDAQFLKYVQNSEVARLLNAIYKVGAPEKNRQDLVSVFLTGVKGLNMPPNVRPAELLRLNTSIPPTNNPKRLGVLDGDNAGYPNGRRLTDDVVDISLQVVAGELVGKKNDLGDAVDTNVEGFGKTFPYVQLPTSGSAVRSGKGKSTTLNVGPRSASSSTGGGGDMPVVPIVALAAGAAFVTGGFLMWLRRRQPVGYRAPRV